MSNVGSKFQTPPSQPATLEPLAVRIPTAMQLIGVRRSTVYALIKAGELRTVKLGRATLITMSSLRGSSSDEVGMYPLQGGMRTFLSAVSMA